MTAEKKKEYGSMRIITIEGKDIFRAEKLTAMKNGKLNHEAFGGILDESLDTGKLCEVYKNYESEIGYPYLEDKKYCRALVNVSFNYAVKLFEQYGRRYVRYGYAVTDADMQDHICVREVNGEEILIAIEIPYEKDKNYAPVGNPISADLLGKYFEYNAEEKEYARSEKDIPSAVKTDEIRKTLYSDGFDIDCVHYVRYKRSAGASRDGRCLFIAEPLYADMMAWSSLDLSADCVSDQASWQAYTALTLSSIEGILKLPKKSILIIRDRFSRFSDTVIRVSQGEDGGLAANEEEVEIENNIFDGEALLDVSVFDENGYGNKSMLLLRNRFFKTCAFNTNLQRWFAYNNITSVSQLGGYTTARKIEDIKLVITESSLKYLKFMPKGTSYAEGFKRWLDAVYGGKNTSDFGIVKSDKSTQLMNGCMAYTNYQLINTLGLSYDGIEKFLEDSFAYLQNIKNDSVYLRHYINMMSHDVISDDSGMSLDSYRRDVVLDMMCRTPLFEHTDFYKSMRTDTVKSFKEKMKHGRVAVTGNYQVLLGNPYEFLVATIDEDYEPTEPLALAGDEAHSTRYPHRTPIMCVRSPHITMGNVYLAVNVDCMDIDMFFNLTENIVCVNSIGNNIQQRLNGCDYDSDSMLVTNNYLLVTSAYRIYDALKVPVCDIAPSGKTGYTTSPESLAELDIAIAENKIGEIVNLSQFLNCLLWDALHSEDTDTDCQALYRDICKLAVLSGMEIDKAKRLYPVKASKVLAELGKRKKKYKEANNGQLPEFYSYMIGDENALAKKSDAILRAPMSFLYDLVSNDKSRAAVKNNIQLSDLFELDVSDAGANDTHKKQNIITAVKEAHTEITRLQIRARHASEDEKILMSEKADAILKNCLTVVSRNIANDHILAMLLSEIDNHKQSRYGISSARHLLFACLLYENGKRLLSKIKTPDGYKPQDLVMLDYYPEDQTGVEYIYGYPHVRTTE